MKSLTPYLKTDYVVIGGGNSYYRDDMNRAAELQPKGIHYFDAGTSGGVWGSERGYCLMIGGDNEVVQRLQPIFAAYLRALPKGNAAPPAVVANDHKRPSRRTGAERTCRTHCTNTGVAISFCPSSASRCCAGIRWPRTLRCARLRRLPRHNCDRNTIGPLLIGITTKFPADKLPTLLHHPTVKMRSGGMPAVILNDSQMGLLVAYLSTLGTPSAPQPVTAAAPFASGMPPEASQASGTVTPEAAAQELATLSLSPEALIGQKVFVHYSCEGCRGIGVLHGTVAAPGLAGTASILPASVLENLLRHHSVQMQQGGMPLTNATRGT